MEQKQQPWYKTFYGEDHHRLFAQWKTPQRNATEVEQICALLKLADGSSILDLCCGTGRHAVLLASRGYKVSAQDLNEAALKRAFARAEEQNVQVQWHLRDMRDIPFEEEFDAIINISTAFGYLEDENEDQKVLQQVYKALKPGGLFLLEIIHRDGVLRNYLPFVVTRCEDGSLIIDERTFNLATSRNEGTMTMIFPNERRAVYTESVRLYTLKELIDRFADANLQVHGYYGGLNGQPLSLEAHRMVIIGRKPTAL
jgi:SAM-dependent methyltransferase